MLDADVGIVGGGVAGSIAAAMLGRAGISSLLIDVHQPYPPDFRCEKIDRSQLALLAKTGLAAGILRSATPVTRVRVVRFGRHVGSRANNQAGILYRDLVNAARAQILPETTFVHSRVAGISPSPETQTITTADGRSFSVRLVLLATGPNNGLRQTLGISREELSPCHSVSIGFDLAPHGRERFDFPALTYIGERPSSRVSFMTLFPIETTMRANLFVYRPLRDPWLQRFKDAPEAAMQEVMPRLRQSLGDFRVTSAVQFRPVDLYRVSGHRQLSGVVLVGDAFGTSCPAAGTGLDKVLTDVERLCHVYIPRWLATDGMTASKIAAFYDDPAKIACDAMSLARAYYMRSLAVDGALRWTARRAGWFCYDIANSVVHRRYREARSGEWSHYPSSPSPGPFLPAAK